MTIPKDNGRAVAAPALIVAAALSLLIVTTAPPASPLRIVAGLALFIALPGIGLRGALMRPSGGLAPWETIALAGALGLAASSLGSVIMLAGGVALTEGSVGLMCAAITVLAAIFEVVRPERRPAARSRPGQALGLLLVLAVIVLGSVVGAVAGTNESADQFTVFSFEDPAAARTAFDLARSGTGSTIDVVVESHESAADTFQVQVVGGSASAPFVLEPSERVVIPIEIGPTSGDTLEIRLLRGGSPYRSLELGTD